MANLKLKFTKEKLKKRSVEAEAEWHPWQHKNGNCLRKQKPNLLLLFTNINPSKCVLKFI